MLQLLRYENELIKSREIVPTAENDEVPITSPTAPHSITNNPIETVEEFESKEDMHGSAKHILPNE
jgi:hypothetical protein